MALQPRGRVFVVDGGRNLNPVSVRKRFQLSTGLGVIAHRRFDKRLNAEVAGVLPRQPPGVHFSQIARS
jgi:hypothetical protein